MTIYSEKYYRLYNMLIEDARKNPKLDEYKERHHILPVCMGGKNNKENLVFLTARQHFIAHWMLYRIYKNKEMAYAFYAMCMSNRDQDIRIKNSRLFKYAREIFSQNNPMKKKEISSKFCGENNPMKRKEVADKVSKAISGEKHPMYGKKHKEISLEKLRAASSGENNSMYGKNHTEDALRKMSENRKGKGKQPKSEETKAKISAARKKYFEMKRLISS